MLLRALLRQRRRAQGLALGLLCLGLCAPAQAQVQPGLRLNRYVTAAPGSRFSMAESLVPAGAQYGAAGFEPGLQSIILRLDGNFAHDPLVVSFNHGPLVRHVVREQASVDVSGSIHVSREVRLGLSIPVQVWAAGESTTDGGHYLAKPSSPAAFGDMHVDATYRIDTALAEALHAGLTARLWLPTGVRPAYAGNGTVVGDILITAAGEASLFVWSVSAGVNLRDHERFANIEQGTGLTAMAAVGVQNSDRTLLAAIEVPLSTVLDTSRPFSSPESGVDPSVSVNWRFMDTLGARVAAATGLMAGLGEFDWRVMGGLEWQVSPAQPPPPPLPPAKPLEDTDHDGVLDPYDACWRVAGDPNLDGCPDADHDGIQEANDLCPQLAGDAKWGGCPDTDHDGIPDPNDACPLLPGDANRTDGCPDADHDGVIDPNDACPQAAGDPNRADGCADRDGDGVVDTLDSCPDAAGPAENHGCAKPSAVTIGAGKLELAGSINFETGKDVIKSDSFGLLDALVKVLNDHPEIAHLSIEGHTDNQGKADKNLDLSKRRAKSVQTYAVTHGIDAGRLESTGFGQERPVVPNTSSAGRAKNRRVEFLIKESAAAPPG